MNLSEKYKKISWAYEIPKIFDGEIIYQQRLDSLPRVSQENLIYQLFQSIGNFFGKIPGSTETEFYFTLEQSKENLRCMMEVWLNGLCDLPVSWIIEGLLDVLNLKTEYQKFPPNSVIEFFSICKKNERKYSAPYHVPYRGENALKIGYDRNVPERILSNIFSNLGKNYKIHLEKKIDKLIEKINRSEKEERELLSMAKSLEIVVNLKKC